MLQHANKAVVCLAGAHKHRDITVLVVTVAALLQVPEVMALIIDVCFAT